MKSFIIRPLWVEAVGCTEDAPAVHQYESHFLLPRPAFPKFYVKSLKKFKNIGIFRQR